MDGYGSSESRTYVLINTLKGFIGIIWPYAALQLILRAILFISCIGGFLSSDIVSAPLFLIGGFVQDVIMASHVALVVFAFISLIPLEMRSSVLGRVFIRIFIDLLSCAIAYVAFVEAFTWFFFGSRFYSDFSFYGRAVMSALGWISHGYGWYSSAFLLALFVGTVAIAISAVIRKKNLSFSGDGLMLRLSPSSLRPILLSFFLLITFDLYNGRFDPIGAMSYGKINQTGNRYIGDLSKNGVYEVLTNSLARIWDFSDRYISFRPSQDSVRASLVKSATYEPGSIFVGDESDIRSDFDIKVVKPKGDKRLNLLVVQLDGIPLYKSSMFGFGTPSGTPYGLHTKTVRALSAVSEQGVSFSDAYAVSSRRSESLFSMMFSVVPTYLVDFRESLGLAGNTFSLPNVLKGQGYVVKAFARRSADRRGDNSLLLRAGFDITYTDTFYRDLIDSSGSEASMPSVRINVGSSGESINFLSDSIVRRAKADIDKGNNFFYYVSSDLFLVRKRGFDVGVVAKNMLSFLDTLRKESWFKDTIVVFIGSSAGVSVDKLPIVPDAYRIPWIIVNSSARPSSLDCPVSHLDFAPTMMSLLGIGYISRFQGLDALSCREGRGIPLRRDGMFGYVLGDRMLVMAPYRNFAIYSSGRGFSGATGVRSSGVGSGWALDDSADTIQRRRLLLKLLTGAVDNSFVVGLCAKCSYTTVSLNKKEVGWSCGNPYHKPINSDVLSVKLSESRQRATDVVFMEGTAFIQTNAILAKRLAPIEHNMIRQSDFS